MTHGVAPGAVERRVGTWAVREPDLVALIDEGGAGEGEEKHCGCAQVLGPDACGEPLEVVVRHHPGNPSQLRGRPDRRPETFRLPGGEQELEGEDEVEHLEVARVLARRLEDLADQ